VYANRKEYLTRKKIEEIADGRVYTASQALELKLIDEIGYFDAALEKTLSMASLRAARVVAYTYYPGRKTNIYASSSKQDPFPMLKGTSLEKLFPFLKSGFYYLWLPELNE
jgi:protease-4